MQHTEIFIYSKNYDVGIITQRYGIYKCIFECWRDFKKAKPHITVYLPDVKDFDRCIAEEFLHDVVFNGLSNTYISSVYDSEYFDYIPYEVKEKILAKDNIIHCAVTLMTYLYGV